MITAEIRVNCGLIGHVYCVNEEGEADGWCTYRYEYYELDCDIVRGHVKHFRPAGAASLLKKIFEDIESKMKGNKE